MLNAQIGCIGWVKTPTLKESYHQDFFFTFLTNMLLKILHLYIGYLGLKLGVQDQQPNNSYFIFQGLDVIVANKHYTIPCLGLK